MTLPEAYLTVFREVFSEAVPFFAVAAEPFTVADVFFATPEAALGVAPEAFFAFAPSFSLAETVDEVPLAGSADRLAPALFAAPGVAAGFAAALAAGLVAVSFSALTSDLFATALEAALGVTAGFSALGAFASTAGFSGFEGGVAGAAGAAGASGFEGGVAGFSDPAATSASVLTLASVSVLTCAPFLLPAATFFFGGSAPS